MTFQSIWNNKHNFTNLINYLNMYCAKQPVPTSPLKKIETEIAIGKHYKPEAPVH